MSRLADKHETDDVEALRRRLVAVEAKLAEADRQLAAKSRIIDKLQDIVTDLVHRRWGRSSEKHSGQAELSLFNEAEIVALKSDLDAAEAPDTDGGTGGGGAGAQDAAAQPAPAGTPRTNNDGQPRKPRRALPEHLERVRILHELHGHDLVGPCGRTLVRIGEEITEQIGVLPARQFVIEHVKLKYACPCKRCGVRTAPMPAQPLPGAQASPSLLAFTFVSKYHDALPLYRQEQIWARSGIELPRAKLARWLIDGAAVLQPLYNLMEETLFDYDITMSDDTGIQVLKENGRAPGTKSALWIRRGGAPSTPVVLVDYDTSKGAAVASRLLDQSGGYLIIDAAPSFDAIVARNELTTVLCNDHARRKFVEATRSVAAKKGAEGWVATKAIGFYKRLYALEKALKELPARQRHERRQREALPIWKAFMDWAKQVQTMGVRHAKTRTALAYLIRHEAGLMRYLEDGRLPISNILSEHVAKTIAVARKNFLFSCTPAGATASALIYSVLESAKANGHNALHYTTAVLAALPGATTVEEIEALLPWRMSVEEAAARYAAQPAPPGALAEIAKNAA